MENSTLLVIAIRAALKAGEAIMEIYETGDFGVEIKSDKSPLTIADVRSHGIIDHHLFGTEIPILSEEGKDIPYKFRKDWKRIWIVDPIDGTKEFIKRNGEFTVNIALIEDGKPVLGVIYVPATKVLYFGSSGEGSFKAEDVSMSDDMDDIRMKSNRLPIENQKAVYTVVASRSHMSTETKDFIGKLEEQHGKAEIISKGSSLKICMVAEGQADCYPRFAPTMEWDTAAGHAIASAAGCSFIDWDTKEEMKYNRENLLNNWFLVCSNPIQSLL